MRGSSKVQAHVCAIGYLERPVELLKVTNIGFTIHTELPVQKRLFETVKGSNSTESGSTLSTVPELSPTSLSVPPRRGISLHGYVVLKPNGASTFPWAYAYPYKAYSIHVCIKLKVQQKGYTFTYFHRSIN